VWDRILDFMDATLYGFMLLVFSCALVGLISLLLFIASCMFGVYALLAIPFIILCYFIGVFCHT
jgi:hypothetical protein